MSRRLVFVLAVVACCTTVASGLASGQQKITIKWWGYPIWEGVTGKETLGMATDDPRRGQYTRGDWYVYVADQFMKENPGVKIEFELLSWQKGREKVDISILGGSPPDLLGQENNDVLLKYAIRGVLEPIDAYLTKEDVEDFLPTALGGTVYEGKHWFWPWLLSSEAIQANTVIYKERGVSNLLPTNDLRTWTFEQFLQALQKTTFDRNGDGVPDVYGYGIAAGEEVGDFYRNVFLWGAGVKLFDRTGKRVNLTTREAEAALQFMVDLEHKYKVVVPGSVSLTRAALLNHWLNGKIAVWQASPHSVADIKAAEASGAIKAGTVESYLLSPPAIPAVGAAPRVYSTGFGVFRQKDPAKGDMVMKFARFLTDKVNCKAVAAFEQFPVRKSSGNLYPGDEHLTYLAKLRDHAIDEVGHPYITALRAILTPMFQAVLTRARTPAEALKEANAKANAFLEQQFAQ